MNYLVACDRFFNDEPSGSARVAWDLARLVKARGHDVALVCQATEGDGRALDSVEGIQIVRYPTPAVPAWHPRRLSARASAARDAVAALHLHWDVVHSHSLATGQGAFDAAAATARRIATIHSPALLEQRINWSDRTALGLLKRAVGLRIIGRAEARLYRAANGLSALSQFTIEEVRRIYGEDVAARITRIPWWCDGRRQKTSDDARRRLGWPRDRPIVFTLRRLVRRMGIDTLIEAVGTIRDLPCEVYVAGTGPEEGRLRDLARRRGVAGRVQFLGRVTDGDAALAYEAADAFVLPTRELECFGLIALEALARGCPVIASRAGALPEVLGPECDNLLFPPGDSAALARLLRRVLERPGALLSAGELEARTHARYAASVIQQEYLRFIGASDAHNPGRDILDRGRSEHARE